MTEKPNILVILGPTASGKTAAAIEICRRLDGEIISADSRQIYRFMDIGTAKPTRQECAAAQHHLIDFLDPAETWSAGDFVRAALVCIEDIKNRGKLPVIAGGATLYIRSLTHGIFAGGSFDDSIRAELMTRYDRGKGEQLHQELRRLDPEYAEKVHLNDRKKLVRFFEVYHTTGYTISQLKDEQSGGWIEPITIGLHWERSELYDRIDRRVDMMMENGLPEEVKRLRKMGYDKNLNSLNSPGYKELFDYLDGECTFDDAVETIKRNTRRYAKRQMTWFRKDNPRWFPPDDIEGMVKYIGDNL